MLAGKVFQIKKKKVKQLSTHLCTQLMVHSLPLSLRTVYLHRSRTLKTQRIKGKRGEGRALSSLICSLAPHSHSFVKFRKAVPTHTHPNTHNVKWNRIYNKTEAVGQQVCVKQSRKKKLCLDGKREAPNYTK